MLYNNNMKELSKIKSIMTRINRKCDKENTSLSNVLKNMNISNTKFLEILGLNPHFLDANLENLITNLFDTIDTRIDFDPNMDLVNCDIGFYSKNLNTDLHFSQKRLSIINVKSHEDDDFVYKDEVGDLVFTNHTIHYELKVTIDKGLEKPGFINRKSAIKHMNLKVSYKTNEKTGSYEFTINNDMLLNDLDYIMKCLISGNFVKTYLILDKYPCTFKIIDPAKEIE